MTKIYTKKGDEGNTYAFSGVEYRKNDTLIEVNGLIDEALVSIQKARRHFTEEALGETTTPQDRVSLERQWDKIIEALYLLGAEVSSGKTTGLAKYIVPGFIERLEEFIDEYYKPTTTFTYFYNESSIDCEEARVRVRRLERYLTSLLRQKRLRPVVYQYVNRLSDFLFTMSLHAKGVYDLRLEENK